MSCINPRRHAGDPSHRGRAQPVRSAEELQQEQERRAAAHAAWVSGTVLPTLRTLPLFNGMPEECLTQLADELSEGLYHPGKAIVRSGDTADSMMILLEGFAAVETKDGNEVGELQSGAAFGEAALLGTFPMRTATVRALSECRVLQVSAAALQSTLEKPEWSSAQGIFQRLSQARARQVQLGLPMSCLPIHAPSTDVGIRAVALQAERFDLVPGEIWLPSGYSDADPSGLHFAVIAAGKAQLEVILDERPVMPVRPGALLIEDVIAKNRAQLRALSQCEGYRVRFYDLMLVVESIKSADRWYKRFRLLYEDTRRILSRRLTSVRGVAESCAIHPDDDYISGFIHARKECRHFAELARKQRLTYSLRVPLPPPKPAKQQHTYIRLPSVHRHASAPVLPPSVESSRPSTASFDEMDAPPLLLPEISYASSSS